MSETSDTPTVRTSTAPASAPAAEPVAPFRTPRVFIAAAWVAIVAGIVFIVSVIFFTGMALGHHGGHHHHHHKQHMMMHPHRFGGPGGPGGPGAPGGPPGMNQGGGPASVAPGAPGPGQIPSSVAPTRTP